MSVSDDKVQDAIVKSSKEAAHSGDSLPFYTIDKPEAVSAYYESASSRAAVMSREGLKDPSPIPLEREQIDIEKAKEVQQNWKRMDADFAKGGLYEDVDRAIDARAHAHDSGYYARDIPSYVKGDMAQMEAYREGISSARTDMSIGELEDKQDIDTGKGRGRLSIENDRSIYDMREKEINSAIKEYEINHAKEAEPRASYSGRIETLKDNYAYQRTDDGLVKHDLSNVSPRSAVEKIKEGANYDFKYPTGKAGLMKEPQAHEKQKSAQHTFER